MAGTKSGGRRASLTNKQRHGDDFYKRIGALGGMKTGPKGFGVPTPCNCMIFASVHKKSECAGAKGGRISRRGKAGEYKINVTIG